MCKVVTMRQDKFNIIANVYNVVFSVVLNYIQNLNFHKLEIVNGSIH